MQIKMTAEQLAVCQRALGFYLEMLKGTFDGSIALGGKPSSTVLDVFEELSKYISSSLQLNYENLLYRVGILADLPDRDFDIPRLWDLAIALDMYSRVVGGDLVFLVRHLNMRCCFPLEVLDHLENSLTGLAPFPPLGPYHPAASLELRNSYDIYAAIAHYIWPQKPAYAYPHVPVGDQPLVEITS